MMMPFYDHSARISELEAKCKEYDEAVEMLKDCAVLRKADVIREVAKHAFVLDHVHFDSVEMGSGTKQ